MTELSEILSLSDQGELVYQNEVDALVVMGVYQFDQMPDYLQRMEGQNLSFFGVCADEEF